MPTCSEHNSVRVITGHLIRSRIKHFRRHAFAPGMDEIVRQAMAKWPNVPHCYGWLMLDARGVWRMRDEHAQALKLPGNKINNPALLEFIHRNYTHDERGQWYFQNGPQRVYVDLAATPFIARTDPLHGLVLHTGEAFSEIDSVWMTEHGEFVFHGAGKVAMLDDRDLAQCIEGLRNTNTISSEEELSDWLAAFGKVPSMTWRYHGRKYSVQRIVRNQLAIQFGFIQRPARNFSSDT